MGHLVHLDVDATESNGGGTSRCSTIHARIQWRFELRALLFTALDCLPLWITSRRRMLLLGLVHEIPGAKWIIERIGHEKRGIKVRTHH